MGNGLEFIDSLVEKYKKIWWETESSLDVLVKKYTIDDKKLKESKLSKCTDKIFKFIDNIPEEKEKIVLWQNDFKKAINEQARINLEIKDQALEDIIVDGFLEVTHRFIDSVKKFDPDCKMVDIMQAMRNVWIMNLIQVISNNKVEHTPSIFAYSMLYPYTDNFLDDPEVSCDDKCEFNKRLRRRLQGEKLEPENVHENKTYQLINMIENQYDRKRYPDVFKSIISIHNGQCKSLKQQSKLTSPYENDILAISAEKGGTSVLADAYLVCGDMDNELIELMFGFGFVLQLIDDLQDTENDMKSNNMTIFSQTAIGFKLDSIASKLISFSYKALEFERYTASPYIVAVKELIHTNSLTMIYEAISNNKSYFTKNFLNEIEEYSPLSFSFFKKSKRQINSKLKKIQKKEIDIASLFAQ
jgi:hypothetical protein